MAQRKRRAYSRRAKRTENVTPPSAAAPLSPHWAFVVQLRQGTPLTPAQLSGRVEHIVSGQATLCTSLAELLAFMEQVLTE